MWTCSLCDQQFVKNNQAHSCNDKVLADFFKNKPESTIALFWNFVEQYRKVGNITVHPTKSMIAIAGKTRIAYVTQLSKTFVDIVFPFKQRYDDNLCFHKIAQVPGSQQFNHHFRMLSADDINEEVQSFMKLAYDQGQ